MIDLYGSSVEIYFVSPNGKPQSIHSVAKASGGQSSNFANFVESVSVSIDLFRFTKISVTLAPPINEAVALINSGIIGLGLSSGNASAGGSASPSGAATAVTSKIAFNKIKLRLHSGGLSSAWMEGILLAPEVSIGPDAILITIKAIGLLWETTKNNNARSFRAKTGQQIIDQLTENGQKYEIVINPKDSQASRRLNKILNLNQNISNWQTLADLLEKENCRIIDRGASSLDGKTRYEIISMEYARSRPDLVRTFVAFQQINPAENIFPILGLETSLVNYFSGQTIGSFVDAFNSVNKELFANNEVGAKTASEFSSKVASPDKTIAGAGEGEKPKITAPAARGEDGHPALDMIKGAFQAIMDTPMEFTLTTIAIVDQLPGRIANIRVADAKFLRGSYDIISVTHEISQGGAETILKLSKTFGLVQTIDAGVQSVFEKIGNNKSNFKESSATGLLGISIPTLGAPGLPKL